MNLILRRIVTANGASLGVLGGLSRPIYVLEEQWRDNQPRISCVPAGEYDVVPHGWEKHSPFKNKNTWRLLNVPGRTGILIHAGNTHRDTEGCLLVGLGFSMTEKVTMVTSSVFAMELLRKEIGERGFKLKIIEEAGAQVPLSAAA